MANYTTNLNLKKPADSDTYDIADFNGNMDTLDAKIGAVGNTSLQSQVTTLRESVSPTLSALTPIQNQYYEIDAAYAITIGKFVIVSFAVKAVSTATDWVNIINLPGAASASFALGKYDSSGDVEFDVRQNGNKLRAAGGLADSHWRNAVFAYIVK